MGIEEVGQVQLGRRIRGFRFAAGGSVRERDLNEAIIPASVTSHAPDNTHAYMVTDHSSAECEVVVELTQEKDGATIGIVQQLVGEGQSTQTAKRTAAAEVIGRTVDYVLQENNLSVDEVTLDRTLTNAPAEILPPALASQAHESLPTELRHITLPAQAVDLAYAV